MNENKYLIFLYAILLICVHPSCGYGGIANKENLKILYVGGSSNWNEGHFACNDDYIKDIEKRTNSFLSMLREYFFNVQSVDAKKYSYEMSDNFDVTIFDAIPPAIGEATVARAINDTIYRDTFKMFLPDDFDAPAVFIAETAEQMGRSLGLKLDWYCLCLDADAHSMRMNHPIFNTPFKVQLTTCLKPTPETAYHYRYYRNDIPDSIPMWKVQIYGYKEISDFRIGMVSRPWGFEDSPDAEYISSGVCDKTLDAVAIGRHGNFLEWGFAASPEYMTDEAQTVFANAIVYISKFKGNKPIARKYNERVAVKDYIKELTYLATEEAYLAFCKSDEENVTFQKENHLKALNKKNNGDELSGTDLFWINNYTEREPMNYREYLKIFQGEAFNYVGENEAGYQKYYAVNKDYFYCLPFDYNLTLDKEARALRIPNNDIKILDRAISLLESGLDTITAKHILQRYTLCNFASAAEWRKWYNANKDNLFFTQSGGWIFMVKDSSESILKYTSESRQGDILKPSSERLPVKIFASVENGKNLFVKIRFEIEAGYHIYDYVPDDEAYTPTLIKLILPDNYESDGEMIRPYSSKYNDNGLTVFTNTVEFIQPIKKVDSSSNDTKEIKITYIIDYQACDSRICTPPQHVESVFQFVP